MKDNFNNITDINRILIIVGIAISTALAGLSIELLIATVDINSKFAAINSSVNAKFASINAELKAINQKLDYREETLKMLPSANE